MHDVKRTVCAIIIYSATSQHPEYTKHQLKPHVKRTVSDPDHATHNSHLLGLSVQGKLFQRDDNYSYWSDAVSSRPDREMKFAYNAAIDTLPANANLALWYKGQVSSKCRLRNFPSQSLKHVLDKCEVALQQRRFNPRHDAV